MKKLITLILLIISGLSANASIKKDTTVVEFTDKGTKKRLSVYTNGKHDFKIPSTLNLDNLLRGIGVDSSERSKALVMVSQDGEKKDTILVITRDGRNIKIVTNEPKNGWNNSSRNDTLRRDESERNVRRNDDNDNNYNEPKHRNNGNYHFFGNNEFSLYLGLNNWYSNNAAVVAPSLSPIGSRFVALSWRKNITLVSGKKADLAFSYAPEVLWYNFMLDGNSKYINTNGSQVQFTDHPSGKALSTSKLVVPTLNLPVMLTLGLKQSKFLIGVGGYVGYRIDSYSKIKYDDNGGTEHQHQNFNLNDVRYGLIAEIGRKNSLRLFFRYDMTDLFKADQKNAAGLRGWSVGLKLL